jgi:hypothetical protein
MSHKNFKTCMFFLAVATVAILTLNACKRTEREKYEHATSTLKYKAYKTLSATVFEPLFSKYNKNAPDSLQVPVEAGRLLLGYFWMCSGKTTFGFAEGNIILDDSQDNNYKSLAKLMIAIGMFENEWKELAKEESKEATSLLSKEPGGEYVKIELITIHLLLATYSIYDRDFNAAKFHLAGFANMTGIQWPYKLADGMADIENGKIQAGLKKIKALSEDESVPEEVRDILNTAIEEVEENTGDVDSLLFWPRTISLVLYDELKKAAQPGIDEFMNLIDQAREKLDVI